MEINKKKIIIYGVVATVVVITGVIIYKKIISPFLSNLSASIRDKKYKDVKKDVTQRAKGEAKEDKDVWPIKLGVKGKNVKDLQRLLGVPITGEYDQLTSQAMKDRADNQNLQVITKTDYDNLMWLWRTSGN